MIGPEQHGRIRGVGLGPTPSSHPANNNVRSSQPTSSSNERAVFMENRVQMLESEVASLKSTIQMMAQDWIKVLFTYPQILLLTLFMYIS